MSRDYSEELRERIEYIREKLAESGASGIVFGNSGGKDSALVGILCKLACANTVGIAMPCASKRNFGEDMKDAMKVADMFHIQTKCIDLTTVRDAAISAFGENITLTPAAVSNIAPRLRMITLYAAAAGSNLLVAGTGNRSERYMGYFTKWGDGGFDFNPIADLTVTEVYEFLRFLGAPEEIIKKAPSAGLFEGQTDEDEMGVTYASIDNYIVNGTASDKDREIIERYHSKSEHKRRMPDTYGDK